MSSVELSDAGGAFLSRWMGEANFSKWIQIWQSSEFVCSSKDFVSWLLELAEVSHEQSSNWMSEYDESMKNPTEASLAEQEGSPLEVKVEPEESKQDEDIIEEAIIMDESPDLETKKKCIDEVVYSLGVPPTNDISEGQQSSPMADSNLGNTLDNSFPMSVNPPPAATSDSVLHAQLVSNTHQLGMMKNHASLLEKQHAGQGEKCLKCGKIFTGRSNWHHCIPRLVGRPLVDLEKRASNTEQAGKTFRCHVCSYSSNAKGNLTRHMIMHTEMTYVCPWCVHKTNQKYNLKKHIKKFHSERLAVEPLDINHTLPCQP